MKSKSPLRLALFMCDTPIPNVLKTEGNYLAIYGKWLRRALDNYKKDGNRDTLDFTLDGYDVVKKMEYPTLDDYDGIVITGSAASAYEPLEWIDKLVAFMRSAVESHPHINMIGICFGHQIMARALGGECAPNSGKWEVGVYEVQLSEIGKGLFGSKTIKIQQMHRDHIPSIPPSLKNGQPISVLGSTPICPNQGFIVHRSASSPAEEGSIQIFTVQGHPEFTKLIVNALVDARGPKGTGVMNQDTSTEGKDRAGWVHDGDTSIGSVVWDILCA